MTAYEADEVADALPALLPRLWRFALLLCGDRAMAEDLVQATCLRALERKRQFIPGSHLDRWCFSILRSIWLNEVRARRVRQGQGTVDAAEALVFEGEAGLEQNILVSRVLAEVGALPEAQRETVFLVYVEGLSYQEAADMLGIPIGTVMSRLAAARARLAHLNPAPSEARQRTP